MAHASRILTCVAVSLGVGLSPNVFSSGGIARADVATTAKRGVAGVKRGAHATGKAVAPSARAVARGANKGVSGIKRAGNAVGKAVKGQ